MILGLESALSPLREVSVLRILGFAHNMNLTFREEPVEQFQQGLQMRGRSPLICSDHYFFQGPAASFRIVSDSI